MSEVQERPRTLEYGRDVPRWRKRLRRSILGIALLVGLVVLVKWGPMTLRYLRAFQLQQQCRRYESPAGQVVCEEEPTAALELVRAQPRDFAQGSWPAENGARMPLAYRSARCWANLEAVRFPYSSGPGPGAFATLFLHERTPRGAGGPARLVGVWYQPMQDEQFDFLPQYDLGVQVWKLGTPFTLPDLVTTFKGYGISRPVPAVRPRMRFYAGQADPANGSHFTIEYEAFGQHDTVDGWLEVDDSVTFTPRHRPAWPTK